MGSKKKESFEQILKKVKALDKERKSIKNLPLKEILKKKFKDRIVELESQDWDLLSAEVVIDVWDLPRVLNSCGQVNGENRFLPFEIWWDRIYPKKRLFVLEFWHIFPDPFGIAKWSTAKTFEVYLSPENIRDLIKILQKGLEYLEKYKQNEQIE